MQVSLSLDDIDHLKHELGVLLPSVKSSHRVEAMARGLGWLTNAALRTTLRQNAVKRDINDRAFREYLRLHGFTDTPFDALSEAVVRCRFPHERVAVQRVMEHEPVLTRDGFGVYRDPKQTWEEHRQELDQARAKLLGSWGIAEFIRARDYLSYASLRRTINHSVSSYGLKNRAEHHYRDQGVSDNYISNGALIAAAIHLGFNYRASGPNAYFNIGARHDQPLEHPADLGRYSPPSPPRATKPTLRQTAWRNTMVAAINAGLAQDHFGLTPNDNRWSGDRAVYTFFVGGMPALAAAGDGGSGELIIHVAVNPTPNARRWIAAINAGFDVGDAFAIGWLERQRGKWLQTETKPLATFRRKILPALAQASVKPDGYMPEGQFIS